MLITLRVKLLFVFVLGIHLAHAQDLVRVNFPGGRFSMIPPQGFTLDPAIPAFIHVGSASSFVMKEIDSIPYIYVVQGFEAGNPTTADWKQISKTEVTLASGRKGVIFLMEFTISGVIFRRMILFSGTTNYSVMVHATYPLSVEDLNAPDMKKALLSIEF